MRQGGFAGGLFLGAIGCHSGVPPQTPARVEVTSSLSCPPSPQASEPPSEGGYRGLSSDVARESLRGAITDAGRTHTSRRIGGPAIVAINAAVHDLHDELRRCGGPNQYKLSLVVNGDVAVGALVPTEIPPAAERCIANILTDIELPPTDGPMKFDTIVSFDDRCPPLQQVPAQSTSNGRST